MARVTNFIVSGLRNLAPWIACLLTVGIVSFLITRADAPHGRGDPSDITDTLPATEILRSDSPVRGSGKTLTLVEFADFECASCKKAQPVLLYLLEKHPNLKLVFRHFPLTLIHPFAVKAARAAEIAGTKGKFWEMHDALFRRQTEWLNAPDVRDGLRQVATSVGLDGDWFTTRFDGNAGIDSVSKDTDAAIACSVSSTPSFFLITPTRTWSAVGPTGLERLRDRAECWR